MAPEIKTLRQLRPLRLRIEPAPASKLPINLNHQRTIIDPIFTPEGITAWFIKNNFVRSNRLRDNLTI